MEFLLTSALRNSSFGIAWHKNVTVVPHLVHIAKHTRIISSLPTQCAPKQFQQYALAQQEILGLIPFSQSRFQIGHQAPHFWWAPGSSICHRATTLAATSGVLSDLVFANRRQVPFPWSTADPPGIDSTPIASYPDIIAEMPGVLVDCGNNTLPAPEPTHATRASQEPDRLTKQCRMLIWILLTFFLCLWRW
jgi:hypothetical protein